MCDEEAGGGGQGGGGAGVGAHLAAVAAAAPPAPAPATVTVEPTFATAAADYPIVKELSLTMGLGLRGEAIDGNCQFRSLARGVGVWVVDGQLGSDAFVNFGVSGAAALAEASSQVPVAATTETSMFGHACFMSMRGVVVATARTIGRDAPHAANSLKCGNMTPAQFSQSRDDVLRLLMQGDTGAVG